MDRKNWIGGSDAASILGVSPWKTSFQLYQEKIGDHVEEVTQAKQKIFNRGKRLEPVVIEMLIDELRENGHEVEVIARNERYKDSVHDFMAAEIDIELVIDGEEMNGEIKTVHPFAAKDWGEEGTDEIPIYYTAQIAHGQMITGRNRTIVAALIGADDLRIHFVERDGELIEIIRDKEIAFWEMVQNRIPPEPTTHDDIKLLYKRAYGSAVDVTEDVSDYFESLVIAKAQHKELESKIDLITTKIKSFMGDAAVLTANGRPILTWKNNKDGRKTDWKAAFYDLVGKSTGISKADLEKIINNKTETVPGARVFRIK